MKRVNRKIKILAKLDIRQSKANNISKYFGALSKENAERMKRKIKEFRRRANKDYEKRKHILSRKLVGQNL